MFEYGVGALRSEACNIEVTALNVAAIDYNSPVNDTKAKITVKAGIRIATEKVTVGYKMISHGKVHSRTKIFGSNLTWADIDGQKVGYVEIDIPKGAVINCFVNYDGIAQHYAWLSDISTSQKGM